MVVAVLNLLSRHRGGKIPSETEAVGFKIRNEAACNELGCLMDPPDDVEERETNAVLDEDGEVIHIQHGNAGKDDRRQVRRTSGRLPGSAAAHLTSAGLPAQPDTIP